MNHVSAVLGVLLLIFCLNRINGSQHLDNSAKLVKRNIPKKFEISKTPQVAYLEKAELESWNHLEESELQTFLCSEEEKVVKELGRLGVKIFVSKSCSHDVFRIKYMKGLTVDSNLEDEEDDESDESYVFKNSLTGSEMFSETIWSILAPKVDIQIVSDHLSRHLQRGHLIQAGLIMTLRPEAILNISKSEFMEQVFLIHSTRDVYKYFIFKAQPVFFMTKFMEVYSESLNVSELSSNLKSSVQLLNVLQHTVSDLCISDAAVQVAFSYLTSLTGETRCPIEILNVFVGSKRKLSIELPVLEEIILHGNDNFKQRIELLKLNFTSDFIEKLVLKSFESASHYGLIRSIFADKTIMKHLDNLFCLRIIRSALKSNTANALKFMLSTEIMGSLIKVDKFGNFMSFAVDFVELESFKIMVSAKLAKKNVPIFSHEDILNAAIKALQLKKNDLVIYLLQAHYISPYSKIAGSTLVAHVVRENNFEIMRAFDPLKLEKCPDIPVTEDADMTELIKSKLIIKKEKNDPSPVSVSDTTLISLESPSSTSSMQLATTPNRNCKRDLKTLSESLTVPSSEPKRTRKAISTHDILKDYNDAFDSRDEEALYEYLDTEERRRYLIFVVGIEKLFTQLTEFRMNNSIDLLLNHVLPEHLQETLSAGLKLHSEQILVKLLDSKLARLDQLVGDMNIVSQLFKARQADLAFKLIEKYGYDFNTSHSPDHNGNGDIILFTTWSAEVTDKLLSMGASPHVNLFYPPLNQFMSLCEWSLNKNKFDLFAVLQKSIDQKLAR